MPLITFTKIADKVEVDSGGLHGRVFPDKSSILSYDVPKNQISIYDTTDVNNQISVDINDIVGAPVGDAKDVSRWLIENFFVDSNISTYVGEYDDYADLESSKPAGEAGRFAFVLNSQGTKWLPGSLLGTYYGAGWYYDTGSSWSNKNDEIFNFLDTLQPLNNVIVVKQSNVLSVFSNPIDSSKEYFIDGVVDISGMGLSIEIPSGGMELKGYSFNTSKILCTDNNCTIFTSPLGGSGDLLSTDLAFEVSGAGSKLFELTANTGFEAVEFNRVNFDNCTSLGSLNGFRQGLEDGTGRFGGTPDLELIGNWVGGYRLTTSIARNIGNTTILKAGAGLILNGRVLSDINMEGEINAIFSDLSDSNILNDGEFELINANFNGVLTPLTNIDGSSVKSRFKNCIGLRNTYVGSRWTITNESTTTISAINTPVKMAGTTAYVDEQWFNSSSDNEFLYDSSQAIEFEVKGVISFAGGNNDQMNIIVRQWDDSASSYIDLSESGAITLNGGGGNRAEGVSILGFGEMEKDDRVEIWIENQTDTQNITAQLGGLVSIEERPN